MRQVFIGGICMSAKLEMMFNDNKKSTQCRLTQLATLTPVEIIGMRLRLERQHKLDLSLQDKPAGKDWLSDIEFSDEALLPLVQFSDAIAPQPEDWSHYQAQLERYYELYEQFLKDKNHHESLVGRTAPLELKILNAGEAIARDLVVKMKLPEGIQLYPEKDYPKKPIEPVMPEKPLSIYERMLNGSLDLQKNEVIHGKAPEMPDVISDLQIRIRDGYEVTFRVKKIPQQDRVVVGKFFVVFPTIEAARSFAVDYAVYSDQMQPVKEGSLSIKVIEPEKK